MTNRAKWIGLAIGAALVAFGVISANHRPKPFPFLNQFKVLGEVVDHKDRTILVLNASFEEVYQAAIAEMSCARSGGTGLPTNAYCGTEPHTLMIEQNVSLRVGPNSPISPNVCSVSFLRGETLGEQAWRWIREKLGR